jgi:Na+-transporting NADH:ubiquinone oxidoreductase subunit NqrD
MDFSKTTIVRKNTHFTKIDAPLSQNNIIEFFFLCACSLLKVILKFEAAQTSSIGISLGSLMSKALT